jgi:hypothetical protein
MPIGYHVIEDAGQFVGRGRDGLGSAQLGAHPAIENTVPFGICGHAAARRRRVLLSEDRGQLQASGIRCNSPKFAYVRAEARFISAALIKGKVNSLKENRADNVRSELAWNQERNVGFGWGKCGSRDDLIAEKLYSIKQNSRGSYAWKSFRNQQARCAQ